MFSITKTNFIYFHLKIFFPAKKTPTPSGRNLVDLVKKTPSPSGRNLVDLVKKNS